MKLILSKTSLSIRYGLLPKNPIEKLQNYYAAKSADANPLPYDGYSISEAIRLFAGQTISVTNLIGRDVAAISTTDSGNVTTSSVLSPKVELLQNVRNYTYTATEDCYVVICTGAGAHNYWSTIKYTID